MYGTTKALIVAAVALQASANPVGLFRRQAPTSSVLTTTNLSSLSVPTPTPTNSVPAPEATLPTFPLPGSNGTYYICSFPPSNSTSSTKPFTSTVTAPTAPATLTEDTLTPSGVTTSSVSPSAATSASITSFSGPIPTPTPTAFTVVGPSTTAILECIAVPTAVQPPVPGNNSTVSPVPLPTVTSRAQIPSASTSSPLTSTVSTIV